jgi:hypothetical protein
MRHLLPIACLLLSSCALERDVPPPAAGPIDSLVRAKVGLSTGKVKFAGPVTFQIGGAGNSATAIAKAKAPVASAQAAVATATTKASSAWWVYAGLAGLGLTAGFVLRGKLKIPLPF